MTITRFPRTPALLIVMALIAGGMPVRPTYAAGYTVTSTGDAIANDGQCTLREAIQEANNGANTDCPGSLSFGDDIITFSVSGTITLASTLPAIIDEVGALIIDGGENITISGGNSVQVFNVNFGADLTLQNLTVANGYSIGMAGGGISNSGTLTITNSTFSNNTAGYGGISNFGTLAVNNSKFLANQANSSFFGGGGIDNSGTLTVTNSTFSNNTAGYGGGLSNSGTLTIMNSTFSNNGTTGPAGHGGGIFNHFYGTLTIMNSTRSNNQAFQGGGISNSGTLTIMNSTRSNNRATFAGGGILNTGTLSVTHSSFSINSVTNTFGSGGGIDNSGTLTVTNSTFSGNTVTNGGGIDNSGTLTVTNSTFSDNTATNGGGIRSTGTLTLNNTIIANNFGGDCHGSVVSAGYNLIENTDTNACNLTNRVNGNIIGQDPNLGTLTGTPAYFPLNTGSPAIDAGDNAICAAAPSVIGHKTVSPVRRMAMVTVVRPVILVLTNWM